MPKRRPRKKLIETLDKEFSLYIRQRFATNEIVECFTCGKKDHWKKMDCGHFMSRKHFSTRWDEHNCQVQCKKCNVFSQGEQFRFGVRLDMHYGVGMAQNLERESRKLAKYTLDDLEDKIAYYKSLNSNF